MSRQTERNSRWYCWLYTYSSLNGANAPLAVATFSRSVLVLLFPCPLPETAGWHACTGQSRQRRDHEIQSVIQSPDHSLT
jgi:hypothetical protein